MINVNRQIKNNNIFFSIKYFVFLFCFYPANIILSANENTVLTKTKALTPVESLMPMLFGLGVILLVIFGLAFVFRKFSNFGLSGKNIKVIETQMIGAKEKLVIVQVQDQQFLIGVTGHNISQLGELKTLIASSENTELNASSENSFSHIICKLIKGEPIISKRTNFKLKEKSSDFKNSQKTERSLG